MDNRTTTSFFRLIAGAALATTLVAACSSSATTAPSPAASSAPSSAASANPSAILVDTVVVMTTSSGPVLAAANQMTVYTFTQDTANSGKSACTGGCLSIWPALTVPAGTQPTGGDGVSGKLGTITRSDNGALQVTYNGLPLYFYQKDSAPGDTNGNYPQWNLVKP